MAKGKPTPKSSAAKSKAKPDKKLRSPEKPNEASPNPVPAKRVRGKSSQPAETKSHDDIIKELQEACPNLITNAMFSLKANRKMQAEMEKLRQEKAPSPNAYKTPPPRVQAPSPPKSRSQNTPERARSPAKSAVTAASAPNASSRVVPPPEHGPPVTEAAKMQRLRRICERKASGKRLVSEELHKKWKDGSKQDREALCDELERCGWSKEFTRCILQSMWMCLF